MARLSRIRDLAAGSSGWGFFLCARKDSRTGRNGSEYLDLVLQDTSGEIRAKVFQDVEGLAREFDAGEFVKAQGRVNVYQGRTELILDKIRRVIADRDALDGFSPEDCIPCSPRPVDEMWQELAGRLATVADPALRALLVAMAGENEARLRVWPAARQVHHAYRSGLLEHVLKIMDVAVPLAETYGARRDLVIAGALLHDIGKLQELHYDVTTEYSVAGNLVGHIAIGVGMFRDALRTHGGLPAGLALEIEHLILSHHGAIELGSPVKPLTVEALILSAADDLDAKLQQARRHIEIDDTPGPFTAYHRYLERVLYKGDPADRRPSSGRGSGEPSSS